MFLSNWSEVTGCIYFFLSLISVVYGFSKNKDTDQNGKYLRKSLFNIKQLLLSYVFDLIFFSFLQLHVYTVQYSTTEKTRADREEEGELSGNGKCGKEDTHS